MKDSASMQTCAHCGNAYHHTFEVIRDGQHYHFDSFECAIQVLAPRCGHCGCRVIGHGIERDDDPTVFCCRHCLRESETHEAPAGRACA